MTLSSTVAPRLRRVLLVDDDPAWCDFVDTLLAAEGQTVLDCAGTYEEALRLIGEDRHDAYLIDYELPGNDGVSLISEAVSRGAQAPMIMVTGCADPGLEDRARDSGAAAFLAKSAGADRIIDAIGEAVSRPHASSSRTRVLLVDDEPSVARVLTSTLGKAGYRVHAVDSLDAARAALDEPGYDVDIVIADGSLANLGGANLADYARKRRPGVRTLVISGFSADSLLLAAPNTALDAFLQKPFTSEVLLQVLRDMVRRM